MPDQFHELVARATGGQQPYPYQSRLALNGLPEVLRVPTSAGKTLAAVLPWLHLRRSQPAETPRWLVYVLPQRALVEQVAAVVQGWLDRLGSETDLHVLMGGEDPDDRAWKTDPERERIFVGTQDMILSRLLMRGFAEARTAWPMSFGLLNAGVQFVFDEVQLMGPGLPTSLQLQGLREHLGTALPCRSLWMSATIDPDDLVTPDMTRPRDVVELSDDDVQGELRTRLEATRTVHELPLVDTDAKHYPAAVAEHVLTEHASGTRTLVVLNTVERATDVYLALKKRQPEASLTLLHSRFRLGDRLAHTDQALDTPSGAGSIVVSTQVLEAGVDLTSETLITEAAPWTSIVQRAGRCNRDGHAEQPRLLWTSPPAGRHWHLPYEEADLKASTDQLRQLEGRHVTGSELASLDVPQDVPVYPVLRRRDLLGLFDTAPDLSGNDIDVSPFIRDATERTVSIAWRDLSSVAGLGIRERVPMPARAELCPAPIDQVRKLLTNSSALIYDQRESTWRTARADDLRPTALLLFDSAGGGYSPETGFSPASKAAVAPVAIPDADPLPDGMDTDPQSAGVGWVPLDVHLSDTERETRALLEQLAPTLSADQCDAVALAARFHDLGKCHDTFVSSLRSANEESPPPDDTTVWAKSPSHRPLRHDPPHFRHELATALMLLSDETGLLDGITERDLVVYLAMAHHGKVRLGIRRQPDETEDVVLGVRQGSSTVQATLPGGRKLPPMLMDLTPTQLGPDSLTDRALELRDRTDLGPFRLAFCEAVLRSADWRASADERTKADA